MIDSPIHPDLSKLRAPYAERALLDGAGIEDQMTTTTQPLADPKSSIFHHDHRFSGDRVAQQGANVIR